MPVPPDPPSLCLGARVYDDDRAAMVTPPPTAVTVPVMMVMMVMMVVMILHVLDGAGVEGGLLFRSLLVLQ